MRAMVITLVTACAGASGQQPTTGIKQDFDVPPEARSVVITSKPFTMRIVGADSTTETAIPARSCIDLAPNAKHISFTTSVRWSLHFANSDCANITETARDDDEYTRMLQRMSDTAGSQGE